MDSMARHAPGTGTAMLAARSCRRSGPDPMHLAAPPQLKAKRGPTDTDAGVNRIPAGGEGRSPTAHHYFTGDDQVAAGPEACVSRSIAREGSRALGPDLPHGGQGAAGGVIRGWARGQEGAEGPRGGASPQGGDRRAPRAWTTPRWCGPARRRRLPGRENASRGIRGCSARGGGTDRVRSRPGNAPGPPRSR